MLAAPVCAQEYEPTWESLDTRETPSWYQDAKFGIFIHWGLYSVPAWAPKGQYAEWYWHSLTAEASTEPERQKATREFHKEVWGDTKYEDFRPMFTASMYDPEHWAKVFKDSGAKYVVLTSKHHDGYALWPSKEASESFGMAWNSVDSGPKRDLTKDLTDAVRAEGLKMGLYYSIWDWFNPVWTEKQQLVLQADAGADPDGVKEGKSEVEFTEEVQEADKAREKFVKEVMRPQLEDLVNNYQPSLLFSDGDWWMGYEKWESREFLAWLFNNAPNKDEVIVNDRWGKVRGKHGDYFTTEYGSGFDDPNILWEENRGIGHSFGYNKNETLADYDTREELLYLFVDIVSRGGNFLLDVGPTADGRIPVIMEQRLAEIGDWMDVNSEAIYGSRRWERDAQWSEGEKPTQKRGEYKTGFSVMQLTLEPNEGEAVKEAWFTEKDGAVYALLPQWPLEDTFKLKDIAGLENVVLLGSDSETTIEKVGDDYVVDLTKAEPTRMKSGAPYVLKLEGVKLK